MLFSGAIASRGIANTLHEFHEEDKGCYILHLITNDQLFTLTKAMITICLMTFKSTLVKKRSIDIQYA